MCATIHTDNKEITTVKELQEQFHFSFFVLAPGHNKIIPDACLCQIDIEGTFHRQGVKYEKRAMDYFVKDKLKQFCKKADK